MLFIIGSGGGDPRCKSSHHFNGLGPTWRAFDSTATPFVLVYYCHMIHPLYQSQSRFGLASGRALEQFLMPVQAVGVWCFAEECPASGPTLRSFCGGSCLKCLFAGRMVFAVAALHCHGTDVCWHALNRVGEACELTRCISLCWLEMLPGPDNSLNLCLDHRSGHCRQNHCLRAHNLSHEGQNM